MAGDIDQSDEDNEDLQMEELVPRNYQQEILQSVLNENSIVYLPTGAGKTFIAFMAMKEYYSKIEMPLSAGGKKVIFAAPKVAIVTQQYNVLKRQTQFSVGIFNGNMNVDNWSKSQWEEQISMYQVLVMGSQILLDILDKGFLKMSNICLLVLDECHHATESHNMKLIMENHYRRNDPEMPRMLGLTATLVKKNLPKHKLQEAVMSLEHNLCSKIVRHCNDEDLKGLYANPYIKILPVPGLKVQHEAGLSIAIGVLNNEQFIKSLKTMGSQTAKDSSPQFKHLGQLVTKKNSTASDCGRTILDIEHHLIDLGVFGGSLAIKHHITRLKVLKYSVSSTSMEYKILENMLQHLTEVSGVVEQVMQAHKENYFRLCYFSAKKVHGLFDILRGGLIDNCHDTDGTRLCGIVFVERRVTAVVLFHMFKIAMKFDPTFTLIKPDFALGGSGSQSFGTKEYALLNSKMKKSIDRFNAGITNLVFSTDVLEEGIDVPRCNIVVRFDPIKTMCSFIQSKGRARDQSAVYHVLDVDGEFNKRHISYLEMENILKNIQTKESKIDFQISAEKVEPLTTLAGSIATVDNAIRLIYRYCNSFSSGRFNTVEPNWYLIDKSDQGPYIYSILLPASSPHKSPISGAEAGSTKEAKGICALEAVKLLYSIGELDEHLHPKAKSEQNAEIDNKELFKHWKKSEEGDAVGCPSAGTRSRRREHFVRLPDCLQNAVPQNSTKSFVHVLRLFPNYKKIPDTNSRRSFLYDLMDNESEGFVFLTSKPWPQLCSFPIFTNFGEITALVEPNSSSIMLSATEIKRIHEFHLMLFEKVLDIKHEFLEPDFYSDHSNFLVAPAKFGHETEIILNWNVITSNFDQLLAECTNLDGSEENLLGKVVNPTYRPTGFFDSANLNYIVTKVRSDLSPLSNFPEGKYRSFADFYKQKYHKTVKNNNQPLLEVRPISDRLNMMSQGKDNSKSKQSAVKQRDGEYFVPELCQIAPINNIISSLLWLKATTLPTVITRIYRLMAAEMLRKEINDSMEIGVQSLPSGAFWEPLKISNFGDKYESYKTDSSAKFGKKGLKRLNFKSSLAQEKPLKRHLNQEEEPKDLDYNLLTITDEDIINYSRYAKKKLEDGFMFDCQRVSYKERDCKIATKKIKLLSQSGSALGPQQHALYTALTTTTANDAVDMERLEILGDSFLKFSASLYLFSTYDFAEGKLTEIKGKIVGNKNLFYCASYKNIPEIINATRFSPKLEWKPPNYKIPSSLLEQMEIYGMGSSVLKNVKRLDDNNWQFQDSSDHVPLLNFLNKQIISDKCVADCAEAVIGAYVESCGPVDASALLVWFEILPPAIKDLMTSPAPSMVCVENIMLPSKCATEAINKHLHRIDKIESVLGYKFKDRAFLLEALTHSSCMTNRLTGCNQRLEFLGDAVLDFLITCYIYEQCGNLSPGAVTDLRSALVNNVVFGSLTVRFGLHTHMLQNSPSLFQTVDSFVEHQQNNDHVISEEYLLAVNENSCINVASYVEVPKVLGDIWESLAGAVFLDSGKSLARTWEVFYPLMKKEIDSFSVDVPIQPVRMLYEMVGKDNTEFTPVEKTEGGCRDVVLKLTVKHPKTTLVCFGQGRNKSQAKIASAKCALKKIYEMK